jgi:hypothetical protein
MTGQGSDRDPSPRGEKNEEIPMRTINADTFAAAVAIGFQSRGEFGIGTPGPMLDLWLGQQSDEVVLSMVVDHATAREENGRHDVLADILCAAHGRRWGIRVVLSGYAATVEDGDEAHWIVDASDVHAPALSLAGETSPDAVGSVEASTTVTAPSAADCAQADTADQLRAILPGISAVI